MMTSFGLVPAGLILSGWICMAFAQDPTPAAPPPSRTSSVPERTDVSVPERPDISLPLEAVIAVINNEPITRLDVERMSRKTIEEDPNLAPKTASRDVTAFLGPDPSSRPSIPAPRARHGRSGIASAPIRPVDRAPARRRPGPG